MSFTRAIFVATLGTLCVPAFAAIAFVSSPFANNDQVFWSQLGGDQAAIPQGFSATSTGGLSVGGNFATAGGGTVLVTPGSWPATAGSFESGDSIIWTADSQGGTNGPLALNFAGIIEGGLWIQDDVAEQFTAQLQVFEGATFGTFSVQSDLAGDPVFLGAVENTNAPLITILNFSLTACATCDKKDFAVDTLFLTTAASPTPEPSSVALLGAGLAAVIWRFRKQSNKTRRTL